MMNNYFDFNEHEAPTALEQLPIFKVLEQIV